MADLEENRPLSGGRYQDMMMDGQTDAVLRHGFIRKVFSIVSVQLAITAAIAYPFAMYDAWAQTFIQQNRLLISIAMFLPLILVCYISCFPSVGREYPKNYFILLAITLAMGLSVGVICTAYTVPTIALAAGITAVVTFSLIIFAMQTTYDFSGSGPYLWTFFVVLFCMGLILMFFPSAIMEKIYCGFGTLLFSFYIVYDTQLITGGKHAQHRLSLDDYCFGALSLYLDIINLFIFILRIMGERR